MNTNYAEIVKAAITVPQMLEFYGFDTRHKRMKCPIHNGKDQNFSYKEHIWKCFVCGAGGDVIAFIQAYFGLSFMDAVKKLNYDFKLGLPIGEKPTLRQRRNIEAAQKKVDDWQKGLDDLKAERDKALDGYILLKRMIQDLFPRREDEVPEMYIYAIFHINEAEAKLEEAESRLRAYEHNR